MPNTTTTTKEALDDIRAGAELLVSGITEFLETGSSPTEAAEIAAVLSDLTEEQKRLLHLVTSELTDQLSETVEPATEKSSATPKAIGGSMLGGTPGIMSGAPRDRLTFIAGTMAQQLLVSFYGGMAGALSSMPQESFDAKKKEAIEFFYDLMGVVEKIKDREEGLLKADLQAIQATVKGKMDSIERDTLSLLEDMANG